MKSVKFALLGAIAMAAVACGGGATPTPAGATATPAGATATPGMPGATATTGPVAGAGACHLVTQAEMDTVFGGTATITEDEDGTCNVTPPDSFIPIVIRYGQDESIANAKLIVENGEDLTIGGNPAYYGEFMGGILYIEKGGQTLVLQAPLSTEDKDNLIAVANIAITRFP
jgi:hypothetical protein